MHSTRFPSSSVFYILNIGYRITEKCVVWKIFSLGNKITCKTDNIWQLDLFTAQCWAGAAVLFWSVVSWTQVFRLQSSSWSRCCSGAALSCYSLENIDSRWLQLLSKLNFYFPTKNEIFYSALTRVSPQQLFNIFCGRFLFSDCSIFLILLILSPFTYTCCITHYWYPAPARPTIIHNCEKELSHAKCWKCKFGFAIFWISIFPPHLLSGGCC